MSIRAWCTACFQPVISALTAALGFLRLPCGRRSRSEQLVPLVARSIDLIALPARPVRRRLTFVELSPEFGYHLLTAKTVRALGDLFPPFLNEYLYAPDLNSDNPEWTAAALAVRAFRAGFSAKRVLEGHFHLVAKSLSVPWDNHYYVALRTRRHPAGWCTSSYTLYVDQLVVDGDLEESSISHGFPSISEVEIYLRGANRQWPCELNHLL